MGTNFILKLHVYSLSYDLSFISSFYTSLPSSKLTIALFLLKKNVFGGIEQAL